MFSSSVVLFCLVLSLFCPILSLPILELEKIARDAPKGFSLPIRRSSQNIERRAKRGAVSGQSGVGDNSDLLYTIPIELGSDVTAVQLDTGSADLWVITDACTGGICSTATAAKHDSSTLNATGSSVTMRYGDSTTGTMASGPIAQEQVTVAGIAIEGQTFGAVNSTTNPTVRSGAAGIFGLGFPSGSKVQEALVQDHFGDIDDTDAFVSATYAYGPTLARIAMTGELEQPLFAIELQRNTIDIGGGDGMLTVGKLPEGIDNSSLTWVPVRLYSPENGGLRPPSFAPDEVYPFRWEIEIDAVFFNGERLEESQESVTDGVDNSRVSALIDTGNSLLRGPSDVVDTILSSASPSYNPTDSDALATFPCTTPHTLSFQIGGKEFPVDPRDFIGAVASGDATNCVADNLVATDPPSRGALFRWSLGDPFFKSNLVVFHYGNLTHPSVDPPRVGIMSTVPDDAEDLLQKAIADAAANGGNFESTIELAPTAEAKADGQITVAVDATPDHATAAAFTNLASKTAATVGLSPTRATTSDSDIDNGALYITLALDRTLTLSFGVIMFSLLL